MTDSIRIDLGTIRLQVNDGPEFIEFNPQDTLFAERFYGLVQVLEDKGKEYQQRSDELGLEEEQDQETAFRNAPAGLALLRDVCEFLRSELDRVFGAGTSQKLFGDVLALDGFSQFFDAITPYIQKARTEKVQKYAVKKTAKKATIMK
jgi:hypothetical protein